MNTWIIPANMKYYNVIGAYTALDEVGWRLTSTPDFLIAHGVKGNIQRARRLPYDCAKAINEIYS